MKGLGFDIRIFGFGLWDMWDFGLGYFGFRI